MPACRLEDRPGLDANIFGVLRPLVPPADEGVESLFLTQVRPGGGDLSDSDGHRGVVGPFTGLPAEAPASHHRDLEFRAAWWAELVGGTQGVTGCGAQQNADGAVKLSGCQCHRSSLLSPTDTWARAEAVAPKRLGRALNPPPGVSSRVVTPAGGE